MVGWLVREDRRGRRPVLERTQLAGMTVLRAGVPAPDALAFYRQNPEEFYR